MKVDDLQQILETHFPGARVRIKDDSAKHANHSESRKSGGGHYRVQIVSPAFEGLSRLQRHREIHAVLKRQFGTSIHALSIQAFTPVENAGKES